MSDTLLADRDRSENTALFYLPNLRLVACEGPCAGRSVHVDGAGLVVGRHGTPLLATPGVSRRHAAISYRSGRFLVADLGSRNGTYVNGARVKGEIPLHPGDVLELAEHRFVVELGGPGAERPVGPTSGALPATSPHAETRTVTALPAALRVSPPPPPRPRRGRRTLRRLVRAVRGARLQCSLLTAAACAIVLFVAWPGAGSARALATSTPHRVAAQPPAAVARVAPVAEAARAPLASPPLAEQPADEAAPAVAPAVARGPERALVVASRHHHHHHRSSHGGPGAVDGFDTDDLEELRELQRDVAVRYTEARRGAADVEPLDAVALASKRRELSALARRDRALRVLIDAVAQRTVTRGE